MQKLNSSAAELIVAVATPPGKGGIGVVRLSGVGIGPLSDAILDRQAKTGKICYRCFLDSDGEPIDEGVALLFAAPNSYTGEDVLELQGHGGPAVLQRLLHRCVELGARLAEPGEFTLRAFTNGRIDLAQAEAIADLINANTERAARLATASMRGALSTRADEIAAGLLEVRSQIEAAIDFDDEDIEPATKEEISKQLSKLHELISQLSTDCSRGSRLQTGSTVALVGAPNAGKSSLLNALSDTQAAIVDPEPGTTRDIVSSTCVVNGMEVRLLDTAGMRETGGKVEQEGMRRAQQAALDADVVIQVDDVTAPKKRLQADLLVHNKIDLSGESPRVSDGEIWLSATSGDGLELLREELARLCGIAGEEPPFLARDRHVAALDAALANIDNARNQDTAGLVEQQAEFLRLAHEEICKITGKVSPDDLLGEIFSRFCIGK